MLSILHPEVRPLLKDMHLGLMPLRDEATGRLLLAIKLTKEGVLATRKNGGFKFYVAPLQSTVGIIPALVTAFFDDEDEPLVLKTTLFADELGASVLELLAYDEIEIYLFDEHDREWVSQRATLSDGGSCLIDGTKFLLPSPSTKTITMIYKALDVWFGRRTPEDDAKAVTVTFVESLAPDYGVMDMTVEQNDYLGSDGFQRSELVREHPGYFQERDIAGCLRRRFSGSDIIINPFRSDTRRELTDALAVSPGRILLVQAKDSPNTEASLERTVDRKRKMALKQLAAASRQALGAAKYVRANPALRILAKEQEVEIDTSAREIICVMVVTEIFMADGDHCFRAMKTLADEGFDAVVLDYPALNAFTQLMKGEADFIACLEGFHHAVIAAGTFVEPQAFLMNRYIESQS
jgi:hypothetical protein